MSFGAGSRSGARSGVAVVVALMAALLGEHLAAAEPQEPARPYVAAAILEDPACSQNVFTPADDDAFGPAPIGFPLDFFGTTYESLWVSINGYVSFGDEPVFAFDPSARFSDIDFPVIAPFFADVDTRAGGDVTFGNGTIDGVPYFCAIWRDVGYFDQNVDKRNTFQLILIDAAPFDPTATGFAAIFEYDSIQWETGDSSGGTDGFGGRSASIGYSAGTGAPGTHFELPGSGISQSFLDTSPQGLTHQGLSSPTLGEYIFIVDSGFPQAPIFTDLVSGGSVNTHAMPILSIAQFEVVGGYGDGRFGPNDSVSRGQVTKFIALALATNATPLPPPSPGPPPFSDIAGTTHETTIRQAAEAGITSGRPDGTFGPGDPVTRGQMASFIDRACQLPPAPPGSPTFSDVGDSPHAGAIQRAHAAGIVSGRDDGTFNPNGLVTRGQASRFIARAIALSPPQDVEQAPPCRPNG